MKKILFGILAILGIGISFCSAINSSVVPELINTPFFGDNTLKTFTYPDGYNCFLFPAGTNFNYIFYDIDYNVLYNGTPNSYYLLCDVAYYIGSGNRFGSIYFYSVSGSSSSSCEDKDITVFYNSGSSTSVTCDGVQAIEIKGLSTLTSTNTFTPFFNISYKDEDNQLLVESYSKDNLYLENGLFKKTYTGDNNWILTVQGGSNNDFVGYLPTFDITGGITEVADSGNVFNNFAENSVKFAFSNIPSYIQYVIIIAILLFIIGLVKSFKKKR